MRRLDVKAWLSLLLIALLTACSTMQGPQTTQDRLGYVDSSIATAYRTIGNLAARQSITKAEATAFIGDADKIRDGVKSARLALASGKDTDATQFLNIALAGLLALEKRLLEKGTP